MIARRMASMAACAPLVSAAFDTFLRAAIAKSAKVARATGMKAD
jgi:hypothetical protein